MNDEAVFIDANVLLESVLRGRKHTTKAQQYINSHAIIISPLTAHLFVYFSEKDGLGMDAVLNMLSKHRFTDFGTAEIMWAIHNHQGDDFEDAIQVACAVASNCKTFVTFDKELAQRYQGFITVQVL